jgi:hypothetical protein
MLPPAAPSGGDDADADADAEQVAASALRVLLRHSARPPSQWLLARAACVCRAWRAEAAAPEHNAVLRFSRRDGDAPAAAMQHVIARLLERHAAHVQILIAPPCACLHAVAPLLPPGVSLPRLRRVEERGMALAGPRGAHVARAALLRAAPLLTEWRVNTPGDNTPGGADADEADAALDALPHVLWAAFQAISGDSLSDAARAARGLLSPGPRAAAWVNGSALCAAGLPSLAALTPLLPLLKGTLYESYGTARLLTLTGMSAEYAPVVAHTAQAVALARRGGDPGTGVFVSRRPLTLLHDAALAGSVPACVALLRGGADALGVSDGGGCALGAAADELRELLLFSQHARTPRLGARTERHAFEPPLHAAIISRLLLFRLLRADALARHGAAATAAALDTHHAGAHDADDTLRDIMQASPSRAPFPIGMMAALLAADAKRHGTAAAVVEMASNDGVGIHAEAFAMLAHGDAAAARRACVRAILVAFAPAAVVTAALAWLLLVRVLRAHVLVGAMAHMMRRVLLPNRDGS